MPTTDELRTCAICGRSKNKEIVYLGQFELKPGVYFSISACRDCVKRILGIAEDVTINQEQVLQLLASCVIGELQTARRRFMKKYREGGNE